MIVYHDSSLGTVCFSPFTGLIFGLHSSLERQVFQWLNHDIASIENEICRNSLGPGWATPYEAAFYPSPQLLPNAESWGNLNAPGRPLLVNWFITGRCPLACVYCYAEDLMRNEQDEPSANRVGEIGQQILKFQPAVVVITGGDPVFTPRLEDALRVLHGKTGIIVDTSGYTLRDDQIAMFKQFGATVRVSLDSHIPRIHEAQRPLYDKYPGFQRRGSTQAAALDALCRCIGAGVTVCVQTVATKKNSNDLIRLGDVLFQLRVRNWRIFKVAPSKARLDGYRRLVGSHSDDGRAYSGKRSRGPYAHAFERLLQAKSQSWGSQMAVQVIHNETPNSVILVSPDGKFMTESNVGAGKVLIDKKYPFSPELAQIRTSIDMSAHANRYLNIAYGTGATT
ncbi:MAG: radical SAM protein [Planctomycetaceae bacterium]|nr:radical SAM protein [Planctomycetaceae bacterium]